MDLPDLHTDCGYTAAPASLCHATTLHHATALAFAGPSSQPVIGRRSHSL